MRTVRERHEGEDEEGVEEEMGEAAERDVNISKRAKRREG